MGLHRCLKSLSFIGRVIKKHIIMLSESKEVKEVPTKPICSVITPAQRKKFVKPDYHKEEKKIGLGKYMSKPEELGLITIEKVIEDVETGKKQVVRVTLSKKESKEYKAKGGDWGISEASKNTALDGAPGYLIVSDRYGKAVKFKVQNINVDVNKVRIDKNKYNLQGNLRITGRIPVR